MSEEAADMSCCWTKVDAVQWGKSPETPALEQ